MKEELKKQYKPTIALDFDGVIHTYYGWQDGKMGPPIEGAREAISHLIHRGFEVVVFSTREMTMIIPWWNKWNMPEPVRITNIKPLCKVLLDDRAVTFRGSWTKELLDTLIDFKAHWEPGEEDPSGIPTEGTEAPR